MMSRKHLLLRYLESKYIKTRRLSGALRDARAVLDSADLRSAHDSQLQDSGFMGNDRQLGFEWKPLMIRDRFALVMSKVAGKRLTYAKLTGKGTDTVCHPEAGTGQEEPF
jgi:hypothetical protein